MSGSPVIAVGAVVVDANRILMIRRGHGPAAGEWSIPGGRVEFGEPMAAAVVREVAEETGIEVVCGRFVDWVELISGGHHFVIFEFEATPLGTLDVVAGSDAAEAAWIPLHAVAELDLVDGLAEFLHRGGYLSTLA